MSKKDFKEYWTEEHKTKTYYQILISSSKLITEAVKNKAANQTVSEVLKKKFDIEEWDYPQYIELMENYEESAKISERDRIRTDSNTIRIVQKIAKLLRNEKPFIDWALGLGSSLIGFDENAFGQEISEDMLEIAKANLLLNSVSIDNLKRGDSLETPEFKDGIIFFDPPMGGQHTKPSEWNAKRTEDILGSKTGKTAPELLFLTSFFLHASKDSYFIGLFPESIISRINNEAVNLRKFLINHSLKGLIKLESLVLIVGKGIDWISEDKAKELNKDDEIPIIRIKSDFSLTPFLSKTFTSFDDFLQQLGKENLLQTYKRKELQKDNYVIELPYEIKDRKPENIQKIRAALKVNLESIQKEYKQLNSDLDNHLVKGQSEEESEDKSINKSDKKWFEIEPETEEETIPEDVLVLKELYQTNLITEQDEILWMLDVLNLNDSLEKFDDYNEIIKKLKILYEHKRLKIEDNALKIISSETEPSVNDTEVSFNDFIKPEKFFSEIIGLLNEREKRIYQNICDYWLFGNEEKTFLHKNNKKEDLSDIVRTIKLLKSYGLLYSTQKQDKYKDTLFELYQTNRIFHPLFDGGYEL